MNGWHLTLRLVCTQGGGWGGRSKGVVSPPSPSQSFLVRGRPAVFLDGQGFCDSLPADREKQGGGGCTGTGLPSFVARAESKLESLTGVQ